MKRISKIISWFLTGILLVSVILLVLPRLFGVELYSVLSGSMKPSYCVGDLIYTAPVDAEEIKEGDVISFRMGTDHTVVTHRVIGMDREKEEFYTKGDANSLQDGNPVSYGDIIGVVSYKIPKLGYLLGYLGTTSGKIIMITAILAIYILSVILQLFRGKKPEEGGKESYGE